MRALFLTLIAMGFCLVGCTKPAPPPPPPDFTQYLNLQLGSTVKIIPRIGVSGPAPGVVRDAVRQAQENSAEVGTLVFISKQTVTISMGDGSGTRMSYGPGAVQSIEVVPAAK